MKLFIFLCGFFGALILISMKVNELDQQADQTSHEYLDFTFSAQGVQIRIVNFLLTYLLSVIVGAVCVFLFHKT
jgi:hypothetical protein